MTLWSSEIKELESLNASIKGIFPELEKELDQLIATKDPNVVMLYSRRCLEVIISDLCECELKRPRKTEPLKGIIDKLSHEEKIPSHIIASMEGLNSLSTFGAHPKEFDPEQVKPVLNNLNTIIKWYFRYKAQKAETTFKEKKEISESGLEKKTIETIPGIKTRNKLVMIISGLLLACVVIIVIIDIFKIFGKNRSSFDKPFDSRRSIAILPFMNNTGDPKYDHWEYGISELLISALSTSDELIIIDNQTINEVINNVENIQAASVGPEIANKVAGRLNVGSYIYGNYLLAGSTFRINLKLIDTKSREVLKTEYVEGKPDSIILMVSSLSEPIKNWLEIKILGEAAEIESAGYITTTNPEAFRYFISGMEAFWKKSGVGDNFLNAIRIDSAFTEAYFYQSLDFLRGAVYNLAQVSLLKAYEGSDRVCRKMQLWIDAFMSQYVNKNPYESINYFKQVAELDPLSRQNWFWLGLQYIEIEEYDNALSSFKQILKLNKQLGYWDTPIFYRNMGYIYRQLGKYKKAHKILNEGLQYNPESSDIFREQAICALLENDTIKANHYINQYKSALNMQGNIPDPLITAYTGNIYYNAGLSSKAEELYIQALEQRLKSGPPIDTMQQGNNLFWYYVVLGNLYVDKDIDVNEGVKYLKIALDLSKEGYPDHPIILYVLGNGYYKQGKYEEALQALKEAEKGTALYSHQIHKQIQLAEQALASQNK